MIHTWYIFFVFVFCLVFEIVVIRVGVLFAWGGFAGGRGGAEVDGRGGWGMGGGSGK